MTEVREHPKLPGLRRVPPLPRPAPAEVREQGWGVTELRLHIDIDAPLDIIFDTARDIGVHLRADMGRTKVVAGVSSGLIGLGQTVTWKSRHFGITWKMTSKILEVDRPRRFVDEMQRGPFRSWWHEHVVTETITGGRLSDHIRYAPPLGPIGKVADALVLRRHMERLLDRHLRTIAQVALERAKAVPPPT
jgi:ligand-binding SRPBCC domain-containing protein